MLNTVQQQLRDYAQAPCITSLGPSRRTDMRERKIVIVGVFFTVYTTLYLYFDGCVADGNTLEACHRCQMVRYGFRVYAMQIEVFGQSVRCDTSTEALSLIRFVFIKIVTAYQLQLGHLYLAFHSLCI